MFILIQYCLGFVKTVLVDVFYIILNVCSNDIFFPEEVKIKNFLLANPLVPIVVQTVDPSYDISPSMDPFLL